MKIESDVLKIFADDIADRIVRKTVVELRKVKGTLSGEGDMFAVHIDRSLLRFLRPKKPCEFSSRDHAF